MKKIFVSTLVAGLFFTACDDKNSQAANNPSATTNSNANNNRTGDCYVWLYDGDNFTDDNVQISGPGEFANLKTVPNTDKDWDDEADAMKVGPATTVTIWEDQNFQGRSATFNAGQELPDLEFEPRSIKIKCD